MERPRHEEPLVALCASGTDEFAGQRSQVKRPGRVLPDETVRGVPYSGLAVTATQLEQRF